MSAVWYRDSEGHTYSCEADTPCRFANGTYGPASNAKLGDEIITHRDTCTVIAMKEWRVSTVITAGSAEDAIAELKASRYRPFGEWRAVPVES